MGSLLDTATRMLCAGLTRPRKQCANTSYTLLGYSYRVSYRCTRYSCRAQGLRARFCAVKHSWLHRLGARTHHAKSRAFVFRYSCRVAWLKA
jgi:hypothetical protein